MFEKDTGAIKYFREKYTMEEKIYESYVNMRKSLSELENYKYATEDKYISSEEFKQGFIAGLKIMSSLLLDI
ncbi:MAG: hypothetical protein E7356_04560 [Clostridiales bacterium]|nr:hypothetical protein [Clostridiales bacterium]